MKNKRILLINCVILLILGVALIIAGINGKNEIKENPNKPSGDANVSGENYEYEQIEKDYTEKYEDPVTIEETKKYKGLEISSFKLEMISQRECELEVQNVKLKLYDKDGNLQDTVGAQIDSLKPGEQKQLITLVRRQNIAEITKIEIEEN